MWELKEEEDTKDSGKSSEQELRKSFPLFGIGPEEWRRVEDRQWCHPRDIRTVNKLATEMPFL